MPNWMNFQIPLRLRRILKGFSLSLKNEIGSNTAKGQPTSPSRGGKTSPEDAPRGVRDPIFAAFFESKLMIFVFFKECCKPFMKGTFLAEKQKSRQYIIFLDFLFDKIMVFVERKPMCQESYLPSKIRGYKKHDFGNQNVPNSSISGVKK